MEMGAEDRERSGREMTSPPTTTLKRSLFCFPDEPAYLMPRGKSLLEALHESGNFGHIDDGLLHDAAADCRQVNPLSLFYRVSLGVCVNG